MPGGATPPACRCKTSSTSASPPAIRAKTAIEPSPGRPAPGEPDGDGMLGTQETSWARRAGAQLAGVVNDARRPAARGGGRRGDGDYFLASATVPSTGRPR